MKPEQFIRKFGLDAVKNCIEEAEAYGGLYVNAKTLELSKHIPSYDAVSITELMRLVESCDMIVRFAYDIEGAKQLLELADGCGSIEFKTKTITVERFEQAVRDHESIYGGGDE